MTQDAKPLSAKEIETLRTYPHYSRLLATIDQQAAEIERLNAARPFCGAAVTGDRGGPSEACGKPTPCGEHI